MKNCKRPRTSQESEFYQYPTDCSEEEIQLRCEFVKKLKTLDDKRVFEQFVRAVKSYQSGSVTYIDLKNKLVSILRNHQDLLHEVLSGFASPARNSKNPNTKSDIVRIGVLLNKVQALGETVYKAFIGTVGFSCDIEVMIEQLEEVFRDHTSLKEEFKTILIDSRLLKPKRRLEAVAKPVTENKRANQKISENVTPSYRIRPDYVEGSSSHEVLNDKYVLVGGYDPDKVVHKRKRHWRDVRINKLDDKLLEDDLFLTNVPSVIRFGKNDLCDKELCEKPPLGFTQVIQRFHKGKKVPQIFRTDPKNAVRGILPRLQSMEKEIRKAKKCNLRRIDNRVKYNVNK
ncbi:unnamed protein product [Arabis nemorensis]|uniref:Histone deacetylase interacting domain-containing protein n=1 Tax=Arabis nemorensis TaxID=586526 RepID=A0A565AUH0_9BRAS|nr:unnamed protein product [Arabis nemorensis]